jgi:SP family general alpha glucoside:H+ symporter-like MFS transporter
MWQFVLPFIFNPTEANLGAKSSFIFGGLSILCWIYLYFYQSETAGRSIEEIDELFFRKIPARKFKELQNRRRKEGRGGTSGKTGLMEVGYVETAQPTQSNTRVCEQGELV